MSDGKGPIATRRAVVATMGAAMVASVAACSNDSKAVWHEAGSGDGGSPTPDPVLPLELSIKPEANSRDVQPGLPVVVTATNGTLDKVTVTYSTSKSLAGTMSPDQTTWTSTAQIAYGTVYKVTATAVNPSGDKVDKQITFKTASWKNRTLPYLRANDVMNLADGTFGVAQPIVVWWDEYVPDHKAAEAAFEIITEPATEGAWRWVNDRNMHWRPKEYWQPGTKVTVNANVYGMHFGKGLYGQKNVSASFTIADKKQVAIADSTTKHMLCYVNDQLVRDIPISMGKGGTTVGASGQTIDFWTRTGVHVAMDHQTEVRMWSGSYGITDPTDPNFYDEKIKLAVHVSYAGEYVHLADWNIPKQGHINSSHGCINVGPANAQWFYDTFRAGDIVEVKNTPKKLELTDGLGDWTMTWDQWTAEQA